MPMPTGDEGTTPEPSRAGGRRVPRVVVTRPRSRAPETLQAFRERGVEPLLLPGIEIVPPDDLGPLDRAAREIDAYDWVVFTSTAGVRAFADALERTEGTLTAPRPTVAVVGPSTARAVRDRLHRSADLVPPKDYSGRGLLEALRSAWSGLDGASVLLPVSEAAADILPDGLRESGARLDRVTAYRSVLPEDDEIDAIRRAVEAGEVALLTFTSPSIAENFLEAVGESALGVPAAAIGTVTAAAARELGFRVVAVPDEQTAAGLVDAAVAWLVESGAVPPGTLSR